MPNHLTRINTPVTLVQQIAIDRSSGVLTVNSCSKQWEIYVQDGQLLFAVSSIAPIEALERHLKRFQRNRPEMDDAIRSLVCELATERDSVVNQISVGFVK